MVEIRPRSWKKKNDTNIEHEIFINDIGVPMGEGIAVLGESTCKIHGKQKSISGYNQCGYDGMEICVECCREIIKHIDENK